MSWLLLAIFRAARAAYTVVNWMSRAAWMSWRRSEYYRAAERRRELGLPFGRGSEEWIKYLQCVTAGCRDVVFSATILLVLVAFSAGRSSRSSVVISPAGAACMPWDSLESSSSELLLSGPQVSIRCAVRVSRQSQGWGTRPPIMRPGTAPGRAAAAGVASCTRRAIRVSRQWRGSSRAPIMRPGLAPGRAASAEDVGCICRSRAVPK